MRGSLSDMSIASVRGDAPVSGEDRAPAFKRAIGRQAVRVRNGGRRPFSAAGIGTPTRHAARGPQSPGFASRSKIAAARRPPLCSGRCRCARRCRPGPPRRRVIAVKAAVGAADSRKGHHHGDRS
jgi:hypothetical protein